MTTPPRLSESVLQSLAADKDLVAIVLGDLAEELDSRAVMDGERAARRWYVWEAVRTVPYLLRSTVRRISAKHVADLAGIVASAYVILMVIAFIAMATIASVLRALGIPVPQIQAIPFSILMALGAVSAFGGGYLAAWLGQRAPLICAFAFGAALCGVDVIVWCTNHEIIHRPVWLLAGNILVLMAATTAGGLARIHTRTPNELA